MRIHTRAHHTHTTGVLPSFNCSRHRVFRYSAYGEPSRVEPSPPTSPFFAPSYVFILFCFPSRCFELFFDVFCFVLNCFWERQASPTCRPMRAISLSRKTTGERPPTCFSTSPLPRLLYSRGSRRRRYSYRNREDTAFITAVYV